MPYTIENWKDRIAQRSDITVGLVHLTRETDSMNGLAVLLKILTEQKLIGSTSASGFICGKTTAVCFQEAPIYSLAQNIYTEQEYKKKTDSKKTRYQGFGLRFHKSFIFRKKGRPVIYDRTADAKTYLPEDQWWRIVNFDLTNEKAVVDWSHEREWRVPGDLSFSLSDATVLLPNKGQYELFIKKCESLGKDSPLSKIAGIVQLGAVFY